LPLNPFDHPLDPLSFEGLRTGSGQKGEEVVLEGHLLEMLRARNESAEVAGSLSPGKGAAPLCTPSFRPDFQGLERSCA
jgi:hypothetical protein